MNFKPKIPYKLNEKNSKQVFNDFYRKLLIKQNFIFNTISVWNEKSFNDLILTFKSPEFLALISFKFFSKQNYN